MPSLHLLVKLKDVFISETAEYLDELMRNIDSFDSFAIVDYDLNNFDIEFFNQICKKLEKNITYIKRASDECTSYLIH